MADKHARTFRAGPLRIRVSAPGQTARPTPKERLTAERIVDVALEVMATDGYEAASMRRIARELGTGPASLYAHVANREELDQLIVDRVSAEMPIPEADPEHWDEQLKQFMRDALEVYRAHPGSARATLGMIPAMEGALRAAESLMSLCLAGGVAPQAAAWFCDLFALYVGAVAVEESIWVDRARDAGAEGPDHAALWISGYIPKRNYQSAIFGAIDRHLSVHPQMLEFVPTEVPAPAGVFVEPPVLALGKSAPDGLRRLVKKFDPAERDHRNRVLGKAGEAFVVHVERQQLADVDRQDLAKRVRWIAEEDGDGAGYDVLSFDHSGREILIEVKTTNGSARTPFFLTRNEREMAAERPADWHIYRVHLFARGARVFCIAPPLENSVNLAPQTWRASF